MTCGPEPLDVGRRDLILSRFMPSWPPCPDFRRPCSMPSRSAPLRILAALILLCLAVAPALAADPPEGHGNDAQAVEALAADAARLPR